MKWTLVELRRRPQRRWPRLLALTGAVLAAAVVLFGFLGLPGIVRTRAVAELSRHLDRPVSIESVRTNPLRLSVTLRGVAITDSDGSRLLSIREAYANLGLWSTLLGRPHLEEIRADGIDLHVVRRADGSLNLARLGAGPRSGPGTGSDPAPTANAASALKLRIDQAALGEATIHVHAEHGPDTLTLRLSELAADLRDLNTSLAAAAPLTLSAKLESGGRIDLRAEVAPTLAGVSGSLRISDANLAVLAPLLASAIPLQLRSGTASLDTRFRAGRTRAGTQAALEDVNLRINDVQVAAPGDAEPFLAWTTLASSGGAVDVDARDVHLGKVSLQGMNLALQRGPDGLQPIARLQASLARPAAAASTTPGTPTAEPVATGDAGVRVALAALEIDGPGVRFRDAMGVRPVEVRTESVRLRADALNLAAPDQAWPLEAEVVLQGGGSLRASGAVTLADSGAAIAVDLVDLPLAPWGAYLEPYADVWLAAGRTDAALRVTWKGSQGTIGGRTAIKELSLVDNQADAPLLGWKQLAIEDFSLDLPSLRSRVGEIRLTEPRVEAAVSREGRLNVTAILKPAPGSSASPTTRPATAPQAATADAAPPAGPKPAPAVPRASTPMPAVAIGRVVLEGAQLRFSDGMMKPAVTVALTQLSGTIERIDSSSPKAAQMTLEGRLGADSPLRLRGELQAFGPAPSADLRFDLTRLDLVPFAPYSVRFTGYGLDRGHLSVETRLRLARTALDTSNRITIERLTLGAKQPSPQATNLPVPLALALLTDSRGRLVLDLPVAGRVDDPSFHIGPTIARTLVGLLTKVATSPFALLGAAFGGGGEELAIQTFDAGSSSLRASEVGRLATLHRALAERPALRVEIAAQFDAAADSGPLRERELARRIAAVVLRLREAAGIAADAPADPALEVAALASLFAETFPDFVAAHAAATAAAVAPPSPKPDAAPAAPPPAQADADTREGLLARLLRLLSEAFRRPPGPTSPAPATVASSASAPSPADAAAPAAATAASDPDAVAAASPGPVAGAGGPPPPPPITPEQMAAQLLTTLTASDEALQELARARANAVRERLLEGTGLGPERVLLGPVRAGASRVELSLR